MIKSTHYMEYRLLLGLLLALCACENDKADTYFANCRYGEPEAIFNASLPGVIEHDFRLKTKEGVERLRFDSGKELTIVQAGCDSIRQDFQFYLPGSFPKADSGYWVEKAVEEFQQLGRLGNEYMMFSSWAQAIAAAGASLQLTESIEIQPGFYVRIDRVVSQDHANLLVTLSETP